MISLGITVDAAGARDFMVKITGEVENRRDLNEALAIRLRRELKDHFVAKNREPNKMAAPKSNFWNKVADATDILEVTETGATLQVAEQRFNIHLFGGSIFPKEAKFLTVPLIVEARGLRARDYEIETGRDLFTLPGRNALFERADAGGSESLFRDTNASVRGGKSLALAARTSLRAVYALKKSVTIGADPTALPSMETLLAALQEEADDFVQLMLAGGDS